MIELFNFFYLLYCFMQFIYVPNCKAAIKLLLRRTLVRFVILFSKVILVLFCIDH